MPEGLSLKSPGFTIIKPVNRWRVFPPQFSAVIPRSSGEPLRLKVDILLNKEQQLQPPTWDPRTYYAVFMKTSFYDTGPPDASSSHHFPSGRVSIEDFLQDAGNWQASWVQPSHDAVIGLVREVKRGERGEVEHVRLRHECLASISLMNPTALDGTATEAGGVMSHDSYAIPIVNGSADAVVDGPEGEGEGSDGDADEDTSTADTPVLCELVDGATQWFLL